MGHDWLRPSAEKTEQFIDEPRLCGIAGYYRFENVRVTDLLHAAHCVLGFEAVHSRLNRGVRGAASFGKRFLNLAD